MEQASLLHELSKKRTPKSRVRCFFDTNEENNVDREDLFDIQYFSNPGLLAALKEAEEDIAAGRVREVKDSSRLWEGIQ